MSLFLIYYSVAETLGQRQPVNELCYENFETSKFKISKVQKLFKESVKTENPSEIQWVCLEIEQLMAIRS